MDFSKSMIDAVLQNNIHAIQYNFKENPKSINERLEDGKTPLILALENRYKAAVLKLLQLGASVSLAYQDVRINPWNPDLWQSVSVYPLQVACNVEWEWAVEQLIRRNALPSQYREGIRGLMIKAVKWKNKSLIQLLLQIHAESREQIPSNNELKGLLNVAVRQDDITMVNLLVQQGLDVNMVDGDVVPLMLAADMENIDMCNTLIKHGADIALGKKSSLKPNALAMSVKAGWIKAVNTLIAIGMGLNCKLTMDNCVYEKGLLCNGSTVLHLAVAKKHHGIIQTLVQAGACLDVKDHEGNTPLHIACKDPQGDTDVVLYLLTTAHYYEDKRYGSFKSLNNSSDAINFCQSSACVNSRKSHKQKIRTRTERRISTVNMQNLQGISALVYCCLHGNVEMIDLLLTYGADIELQDHEHKTALHHAVIGKNDTLVEYLLKMGMKVDARSNQQVTPLHLSVINKDYTIAEMLLEYGADLNRTTRSNETVLYLATQAMDESLVELFIEKGCDINACTTAGETALMLACRRNATEICVQLIRAGALLDLQNFSQMETGLSMATYFGCPGSARVMISEGADLNKMDKGRTCPVYWCIYNGREDILQLLVIAGVNLTYADFSQYPRHLTLMRNTALVEWIESMISSPRSLFDLCRMKIRENLRVKANGRGIGALTEKLPLPRRTKEHLLLKRDLTNGEAGDSLLNGALDSDCSYSDYE